MDYLQKLEALIVNTLKVGSKKIRVCSKNKKLAKQLKKKQNEKLNKLNIAKPNQ